MKPFVVLSALFGLVPALAFAGGADAVVTIQIGSPQAGTGVAALSDLEAGAVVDTSIVRSAPVLAAETLDLRQAGTVQIQVFGRPLQVARDALQVRSGG